MCCGRWDSGFPMRIGRCRATGTRRLHNPGWWKHGGRSQGAPLGRVRVAGEGAELLIPEVDGESNGIARAELIHQTMTGNGDRGRIDVGIARPLRVRQLGRSVKGIAKGDEAVAF